MKLPPLVADLLAQGAARPHRPQMGLIAIPESEWIDLGEDQRERLVLKRKLLAERHAEVFGALPGSETASRAVATLLFDHLPKRFPTRYPRMGTMFAIAATAELVGMSSPSMHPLDLAGRLIPDDLCLMEPGEDGRYVLTAASLCFPSRWRLHEKLGRPIGEIHGPVPDYAHTLEKPVDRFFAALADGRIVLRHNWTIHDRPDLFQPQSPRRHLVPPERFAEDLHLRVERQTLRRVPGTRAILFTIGTMVRALGTLEPEDAHNLGGCVARLPEAELGYKGVAQIAAPLIDWLAAR